MAVVVYSVSPYRALFDVDNEISMFTFNGVDQYATMPPWFAGGKPRQYWFNFNADAVSTGTEQVIISGIEGGIATEFYLHATLPTLSIRYRSATGTQAIEVVTGIDIVAGNDYVIHVINLGTGSEVYVNNILVDIEAFEASDGIQPPLTHLGAGHELARFFGGQLWSDRLIDDSPITNTTANVGNSTRYGVLQQPIVLEGDFEVSFDAIRDELGAGSTWDVMGSGSLTSPVSNIEFRSTGLAAPDKVQLQVADVDIALDDALLGIAVGQHFNLRITRVGTAITTYTDGAQSYATASGPTGTFSIASIGDGRALGRATPAGAALQNIVIKDLDNNLTWDYRLDEGTGTDIINYDASTQDNPYDQPLWDTTALMGNSTRYIEIPQITVGADEDFRVSFDWIRKDSTGTGSQAVFGNSAQFDGVVRLFDSGAAIPNALGIRVGGLNKSITNFYSSVAQGQHSRTVLERISGTLSGILDNVPTGAPVTGSEGELIFNAIGDNSLNAYATNAAYQNVILENLTTGEYIQYKIDEGAGTTVKAYDINGAEIPASAGTITPDADWQPTGSYTNNGAWTPDTDWQVIPANTRYYPMTEGSGPYFLDALWNPNSAPLYRTDALMGNGIRKIDIPPFTVADGDDFRISFEGIRKVSSGTYRGYYSGDVGFLRWNDPDVGSTPNQMQFGTAQGTFAAIVDIPDGERFTHTFSSINGTVTAVVNGENYLGGNNAGGISINRLYDQGNRPLLSGAAMQNVILENLTSGEAIGYKINEGSGLDVLAYDIVNGEFGAPVPAKNGTITPDADWEYQPGPTDATIQNFDESGWG